MNLYNKDLLPLSDFSYWKSNKLYTQLMENLIESKGFSTIISNLFTDCDVFEPDPSLREDYEISEVELKDCVKKTLLEIKYRYP